MNRKSLLLMLGVVASALLGACADQSQIKPDPVIVHVEDAYALADVNKPTDGDLFKATHVKFGARWFSRCVDVPHLDTRLSRGQTACLTDAEIRDVALKGTNILDEFRERSTACAGPCVPGR